MTTHLPSKKEILCNDERPSIDGGERSPRRSWSVESRTFPPTFGITHLMKSFFFSFNSIGAVLLRNIWKMNTIWLIRIGPYSLSEGEEVWWKALPDIELCFLEWQVWCEQGKLKTWGDTRDPFLTSFEWPKPLLLAHFCLQLTRFLLHLEQDADKNQMHSLLSRSRVEVSATQMKHGRYLCS